MATDDATVFAGSRLPAYVNLERFGIVPDDVVRVMLGCEPSRIHRHVLITPVWSHETLLEHADRKR